LSWVINALSYDVIGTKLYYKLMNQILVVRQEGYRGRYGNLTSMILVYFG